MPFLETRKEDESHGGLWNEVPGSDLGGSLVSPATIQDGSQGHWTLAFLSLPHTHSAFRRFWKQRCLYSFRTEFRTQGVEAFGTHTTTFPAATGPRDRAGAASPPARSHPQQRPAFHLESFGLSLPHSFRKGTGIVPCLRDRREGQKNPNQTRSPRGL